MPYLPTGKLSITSSPASESDCGSLRVDLLMINDIELDDDNIRNSDHDHTDDDLLMTIMTTMMIMFIIFTIIILMMTGFYD